MLGVLLMVKKLVLLVLFCFFILPATSFAEADGQQAYQEFKAMIENHIASYETDNRGGIANYGNNESPKAIFHEGWKRCYYTADSSYVINDVRKTNSISTPFIGIYTFKLIRYQTMPHATKAEAEADNTFYQTHITYHRHTFAYQDGAWVRKTREQSQDNEYFFPDDQYGVSKECMEYL